MDKKPPRNPNRDQPGVPPTDSRWPGRPRIGASNPNAGERERVNHNAYKPVERKENSVWPDPQKFLSGARPARTPAPAREGARERPPFDRSQRGERSGPRFDAGRERSAPPREPYRERPRESYREHPAAANLRPHDAEIERSAPVQRRGEEIRIYGRNACQAVFAKRPEDVRKVYLTEARLGEFKTVLAWCVQNKIGYRVVATGDLDRLTEAQHHEGVCFEVRRQTPVSLSTLLQSISGDEPALLIWLDGVGNPHNVGAMLRSAANFGVRGLILPAGAPGLSGAAMRVAEGGAEIVQIAQAAAGEDVAVTLRSAGFSSAATVPRDGDALYGNPLPARLVMIFGAEGEGMSSELIRHADLRLTIPGSGAVESLNVSASAAVLFGEYWRQRHSHP
jgi:RNA methyltransferase, TrmH family